METTLDFHAISNDETKHDIGHFKAIVENIVDGDTIDVLEDKGGNKDKRGEKIRVRLLGINTPDRKFGTPGYEICRIEYSDIERDCFDVTEGRFIEALSYLQNIILNKLVTITYDKRQPFGTHNRLLALVTLNDEEVNRALLTNGLATVFFYAPNALFDIDKKGDYILAEAEAKNANIGIWVEKGGLPIQPQIEATVILPPEQIHENLFIGVKKRHLFTVLNYGMVDATFQLCERFENMDIEHLEEFKSNETRIIAGSEAGLEVIVNLSEAAIPAGEEVANYTIWARLVGV
jgi:endonuclease YncB( thermonuclease family)